MSQLPAAVKAISIVTAAEMRFGALWAKWGSRKQKDLEDHLRTYLQLPIDDATAGKWASLRDACQRKGAVKRDNDLWIAASAMRHGLALAALDRDFEDMPGLWLVLPDGTERMNP